MSENGAHPGEANQRLSDARLMELSARGDSSAFAGIILRYQGALLNFFRRMGADTGDAEDLAQETLIRLYEYRDRYRPISSFPAFLFTIARHARADMLRKAFRSRASGMEEPDECQEDPAVVSSSDDCMDVEYALSRLSEKLKETVVMVIYGGLTYPEAAEALQIPVGTVKSRMFFAFEKLRDLLLKGGFDA